MKDYKISLFSENKFIDDYNNLEPIENKVIEYIEWGYYEFLFELINNDNEYFKIRYSSIQGLFPIENKHWEVAEYITHCWTLLSTIELNSLLNYTPETKYKRIELIKKELPRLWKEVFINTIEDRHIVTMSMVEEIYWKLEELGLRMIWYSWIKETEKQERMSAWIAYEAFVIAKIIDKNNTINSVKTILEKEVIRKSKWYTADRLKEKAIEYLLGADKEFWTKWINIPIETNNKIDFIIYILLFIEQKIDLKYKWLLSSSLLISLPWELSINWTYLNENNWDVFFNWENLWNIDLNNLPWTFFKVLYDNKWTVLTHKEIVELMHREWYRIEKTYSSYCSDKKREIKSPEIKKLIKSPKWCYYIPE